MKLFVLPESFSVLRFAPDHCTELSFSDRFLSMTRTDEEMSIICRTDRAPAGSEKRVDGWRCIGVRGPLDFAMTGVLHGLLAPLAAEKISVLAIATFDTDYILVRSADLTFAIEALTAAGNTFDVQS